MFMRISDESKTINSVDSDLWKDWKWQQKNRVTNKSNILQLFTNISENEKQIFENYCKDYNFAVTPYLFSQIELDENGNPDKDDPIWKQFQFYSIMNDINSADYDNETDNWENNEELITPILHQKYPGRALVRIVSTCFSYCNYCYLSKRILDRTKISSGYSNDEIWQNTLSYLKSNTNINEVLISGGDPLILDNNKLDRILFDLRKVDSIKNLRVNTRAFTFNPFRIDEDFTKIIKKHRVTAIEIHASHSKEITHEFDAAMNLFDQSGYRPFFLWRTPLLRGVNDSVEELEKLFLMLYTRRITPYYLFHFAPFALGRSSLGVSLKRGIKMLREIRRRVPGPAFPRFTLFHMTGKQDIPLEVNGTPEFIFKKDEKGNSIVRFKNWKNDWVTYPDINDDSE
jgi:lysine 2,3-aminomutase